MEIGYKNEYFKVLELHGINKNREKIWICECICGKKVKVRSSAIKLKLIRSCGCSRKGTNRNITHTFKHGLSFHPLYKMLKGMKERCKGDKDSKFYKDKGITVCPEWDNILVFKDWAEKNGWEEGLTIDRIDNDKGYEPTNCQFISRSENSKKTPIENRRGEKSHLNKLTEQEIEQIRFMLSLGIKGNRIAELYNVTKSNIYCIKNGKSWRWKEVKVLDRPITIWEK